MEDRCQRLPVIHWLSDCRSYIDSVAATGQNVVADKRLAIDMTALRQEFWRIPGEEFGEPSAQEEVPEACTDRLWWIATKDMVADGLTKTMMWKNIVDFCTGGRLALEVPPIRAMTSHTGS